MPRLLPAIFSAGCLTGCFLTPGAPSGASAVIDSAFVEAAGASTVVFVGTVLARPARTTDAVPDSIPAAIVRIDSVVRADSALTLTAGDSVTVIGSVPPPQVGERYGFLSYGWALDSGIALLQRWQRQAADPGDAATFAQQYWDAVGAYGDSLTRRHLPDTDVVIAGPVAALEPPRAATAAARRMRREAAPGWQVARVDQPRVLRGDPDLANRTVRVLFPGSRHVVYSRVPRPDSGSTRIYLLHRLTRYPGWDFTGVDTAGAFLLIHPTDVRPIADTTIVIGLLR